MKGTCAAQSEPRLAAPWPGGGSSCHDVADERHVGARVENLIGVVAHTVASSAAVVPNCSSGPMLCKPGGPMRLQTGRAHKWGRDSRNT